ncbi:MAG: peptide chain release factor N(5)-glutamine methyltransferase [Myxococcota bacterium]
MSSASKRADRSWTVLELLRWTTDHFGKHGIETARLDAECLLAAALDTPRMQLYINFDKPVGPDERQVFREHVVRRVRERVPVAQLVGFKEFWSMTLSVTPDVLTPRPDTETLVSAALDLLPDRGAAAKVLEIGTGTGAVALAIARERPNARVTATDISPAALKVAIHNAESLEMADRVRFVLGDLFLPVDSVGFDLIVSNPPYLAESERDGLPSELRHEPEVALFSGRDGTSLLRALIAGAGAVLADDGAIALELAPAQAPLVAQWCEDAAFGDVKVHRDLARLPRVVSARAGVAAHRTTPSVTTTTTTIPPHEVG